MTLPATDQPKICPLSTEQLIDLVMRFVDLYNRPARIKLYNYQRVFLRRIIQSLLLHDGDTLTGLWSRQSGKSESISSLAGGVCIFLPALAKVFPDDPRLGQYHEGVWIGIFAPKQQQSDIIYGRVRSRAMRESSYEIYRDPDFNLRVTASSGEKVQWSNGSFVVAKTASEQSNVEGHTFHLVIIDEAQYVSNTKVAKEIAPMLAATNGTMVKIGTAHISYGGFRNSIIFNLEKEQKTGIRNHFEFPYTQVIAEKNASFEREKKDFESGVSKEPPDPFHLRYEAWVTGELEKLGGNIENDEFAMNFRLIWKDANVGAIDREAFKDAADEDREANRPSFRNRQVAGLDYGKSNDSTVLTIYEIDPTPLTVHALLRGDDEPPELHRKNIIAWLELQGRWGTQLDAIIDFLEDYRVDTIVADSTAVGDPLTERLQDLLPGVNVVSYPLSEKGNDQLYKHYLQELEGGRITYPAGEETQRMSEYQQFIFQHNALSKINKGRYMACKAPEGEHDDYCDSAALGCWATTIEAMNEIECADNPIYADIGRNRRSGSRADRYRNRY